MSDNCKGRFKFSLSEKVLLGLLSISCNIVGLVFRFKKALFPCSIKKILVLRVGGLGDILLLTPALKALRYKYPTAYISVLIPEKTKSVLNNNPYINKIIPIKTTWWRDRKDIFGLIELALGLRKEKYDLGFDFRGDILNIVFLFLTNTKYRVGFGDVTGGKALLNKSVEYIKQHEIDSALYLLKSAGIYSEDRSMFLKIGQEDIVYVEEFLKRNNLKVDDVLVGFHPSTPWGPRDWPAPSFAALGDFLAKKYKAKIIILGKDKKDVKVAAEISQLMLNKPIIATDLADIEKMVILIQRFRIFICNDSSSAHFAALTDTPTIVLFGPDDPLLWKHTKHIGIRKDVPCYPCRQRTCKLENQEDQCMNLIGLEEVIVQAKNILGNHS